MNSPNNGRLRRTKKVTRAVATVVVWILGVAGFGLLVFLGIGPRTGRYSTLTVLSGSMRPGIPVGAVVVDTPQRASALRVGQIITYAIPVDDHHVISHRVVKIVTAGDRPVFVTKGDANKADDPWQAQATGQTMWRVRTVLPGLGTAIHGLRRPLIHQIGVFVFPVVLAVSWLVSIWREDESDSDESPAPALVPAPAPIAALSVAARRRGIGLTLRWLAVTTIMTVAIVAGMPEAAFAGYSASIAPAEVITTHPLASPTAIACSVVSLKAHISWANTDNVLNPFGNNTIDGYILEHSVSGGAFTEVTPRPGPQATSADDTSFGSLLLGAPVTYRIHSFKSTNWVSTTVSGGFTAHVTTLLSGAVSLVTCT